MWESESQGEAQVQTEWAMLDAHTDSPSLRHKSVLLVRQKQEIAFLILKYIENILKLFVIKMPLCMPFISHYQTI
jgi:hypothetical protein